MNVELDREEMIKAIMDDMRGWTDHELRNWALDERATDLWSMDEEDVAITYDSLPRASGETT